MKKIFFYLFLVRSFPKTLVFNLKYFDLKTALKFPIFVSYRTYFSSLGGNLNIVGPISSGMIKIGLGDIAIFDHKRMRGVWKNEGTINFNGKSQIGHGTKIAVGKHGILTFGSNFSISAETQIVCKKSIVFGANCLLAWDILIMDSDFHKIFDGESNLINEDRSVEIGDNVWIGCRSVILKGVLIANGTIIGSTSLISKSILNPNQVWAGNPGKMIKDNVKWEL